MAKSNQALTLSPDYAEMCAIDDSVGARRYERFKQGESLEEMAEKDKVKVDVVSERKNSFATKKD